MTNNVKLEEIENVWIVWNSIMILVTEIDLPTCVFSPIYLCVLCAGKERVVGVCAEVSR